MAFSSVFSEGFLDGKTAFVAGASTGINFAIAEKLAEAGAKVGLISRSDDKIRAAEQSIVGNGGEAIGIAADVRDYDAVDDALRAVREAYGPIDIVISGAAGNFLAPAIGMSPNAFKTVVDIDLLGTFHVFRACYQYLNKPGASLISITANQAETPVLYQAHAAAAKAGVNALTKSLALEWGPAGVRVNAIAPGPISDTGAIEMGASPEAVEQALIPKLALRRLGEKREIADSALFLSSDAAQYITGVILNCDGGFALGDATGDALNVSPQK